MRSPRACGTWSRATAHSPQARPWTWMRYGDNSIYLAEPRLAGHRCGFRVQAVDKARAKAAANQVDVTFARADVTRLSLKESGRTST